MLTNAKSVHKIEAIQKRALRFILNDYERFIEKSTKIYWKSQEILVWTLRKLDHSA